MNVLLMLAVLGVAIFWVASMWGRRADDGRVKLGGERGGQEAPDRTDPQTTGRGAPGDHYRNGHHRSATAPERHSTATDPSAHAPTPGPNHVTPPGGETLPPDTRP